jgi:hypothetical protein
MGEKRSTQLKRNSTFLILFFLVMITLPLIFSDKAGGKVSAQENRVLASFPTILTSEWELAPDIQEGLENWISDNAGFRALTNKFRVSIDFHLFHISPSSMVHIGKNGWYYYTGNNNLDIAKGTYPSSEDLLGTITKNQVSIQQALKKRGIEYVIVFVPSKASIYPEYIGDNFAIRETIIDVLTHYLRENSTIPVLNLKPDLLKAKESEIVYLKTNTHWNYAGEYVGYSSIIHLLNGIGAIHSSPTPVSKIHSTCASDLAEVLGDVDLLPPEPCEITQIVSPKAIKIENGTYFTQMQEILKQNKNDIQSGYFSYQNPSAENKKLLIYGDSNIAYFNLTELLAENFSYTDFVWSYEVRKNVIELAKPDIVILEVSERMITYLGAPDPALIKEP